MNDSNEINGDAEPRVYLVDGDRSRWIPLYVAEEMIQLWRDRNPAHFGALLAEAYTGTAPSTTTRSRRNG